MDWSKNPWDPSGPNYGHTEHGFEIFQPDFEGMSNGYWRIKGNDELKREALIQMAVLAAVIAAPLIAGALGGGGAAAASVGVDTVLGPAAGNVLAAGAVTGTGLGISGAITGAAIGSGALALEMANNTSQFPDSRSIQSIDQFFKSRVPLKDGLIIHETHPATAFIEKLADKIGDDSILSREAESRFSQNPLSVNELSPRSRKRLEDIIHLSVQETKIPNPWDPKQSKSLNFSIDESSLENSGNPTWALPPVLETGRSGGWWNTEFLSYSYNSTTKYCEESEVSTTLVNTSIEKTGKYTSDDIWETEVVVVETTATIDMAGNILNGEVRREKNIIESKVIRGYSPVGKRIHSKSEKVIKSEEKKEVIDNEGKMLGLNQFPGNSKSAIERAIRYHKQNPGESIGAADFNSLQWGLADIGTWFGIGAFGSGAPQLAATTSILKGLVKIGSKTLSKFSGILTVAGIIAGVISYVMEKNDTKGTCTSWGYYFVNSSDSNGKINHGWIPIKLK